MDTVTYPDPRVGDFVNQHFVPVQVRIKENRRLVDDYLVSWTPNVAIADERGRVHYRVEGFLPPEDFVARLALGAGKYYLNQMQFAKAVERFEEVAQRHPGTPAASEVLYWLGVARYKEGHDKAQLQSSWQLLAQEYPDSEWTERTRIPG
jgi:thioredoxin-related protein